MKIMESKGYISPLISLMTQRKFAVLEPLASFGMLVLEDVLDLWARVCWIIHL